jgi:hypothetical protein
MPAYLAARGLDPTVRKVYPQVVLKRKIYTRKATKRAMKKPM